MLYSLSIGKDEDWLIQQANRMGLAPPVRVKEAPDLFRGLELFLLAFMELTTTRALGYGAIGPIPYTALILFADSNSITGDQREDLFYFVQRLDKAYMDYQTEQGKKAADAAKAASRSKIKKG